MDVCWSKLMTNRNQSFALIHIYVRVEIQNCTYKKKDTCKILAFGVCTNPTFQNFPLLWKEEERMNEEAEEAAAATACIPPHPSAGNFGGRAQKGGKRGSGGGGRVD